MSRVLAARFDTSLLDEQLAVLVTLIQLQPLDALQPLLDKIFDEGGRLRFEVVFCDAPAAVGAGRTDEVIGGLRLGADFEAFIAALRAGELGGGHGVVPVSDCGGVPSLAIKHSPGGR